MKKKIILIFVVLLVSMIFLFLVGCTENERVKRFGGKIVYDLPVNKKFVNVTWKEDNLWILTTDMTAGDAPRTYRFSEKSSMGIIEGEIEIVEHKKEADKIEKGNNVLDLTWDK